MLKTAARLLLLRVLPRRILPIVTVIEALLFLRSIRNRSRARGSARATGRTVPSGPVWGAGPGAGPATPPVQAPMTDSSTGA